MTVFNSKNPLKSTLLFGVFSVIQSGISILLLPLFLNYLSPEDYGIISIVIIYSTFLSVLGSLGLRSAIYTFYFDFNEKKDLRTYLSNIFTVHIISFTVLAGIHLFAGEGIYQLLFSSESLSFNEYGLVGLLAVFFNVLNNIYIIFLKNEINLKIYIRYTLGSIFFTALFQVLFIVYFDLKALGLLLGSLVSNVIIFISISLSNRYLFNFNLQKRFLAPSLKYSLKLLPFLIFFALENQIDRYLIELQLGLDNVGLYALLIKVFGLLLIALNAVDDGIRPFLYRDLQNNRQTTNVYFNLYLGFSIMVLVIINLIGFNLEFIVKNEAYLDIQKYFFLGSLVFLLQVPVRYFGLLLVYYKESFKLSSITTIKLVIMVFLMLILIPKYKLYGVLLALCVSHLTNSILFAIILYDRVRLKTNFKTIFYLILFVLSTYFLFEYLNSALKLFISIIYTIGFISIFLVLYLKESLSFIKENE